MSNQKILIIGGSGFLSGTLANLAVSRGDQVWTLTRGERPIPGGVTGLTADRHNLEAFEESIAQARTEWDLVVDCIAYDPADIKQDIAVFRNRARQLIFVSTDFVFDPLQRRLPQSEETDHYLTEGYGGKKRLCELELFTADAGLAWTIVRPGHIYGPGSLLGCLPRHGRDRQLIARLKNGEALQLVGGGYFLQQPILAQDLAELILSMAGAEQTYSQIYCAAGPDIIQSRDYYQIIADILGVALHVEESPVDQYLAENPGAATFLCHRIYDLSKLQAAGVAVPGTPIEQGLRAHVASLLEVKGS